MTTISTALSFSRTLLSEQPSGSSEEAAHPLSSVYDCQTSGCSSTVLEDNGRNILDVGKKTPPHVWEKRSKKWVSDVNAFIDAFCTKPLFAPDIYRDADDDGYLEIDLTKLQCEEANPKFWENPAASTERFRLWGEDALKEVFLSHAPEHLSDISFTEFISSPIDAEGWKKPVRRLAPWSFPFDRDDLAGAVRYFVQKYGGRKKPSVDQLSFRRHLDRLADELALYLNSIAVHVGEHAVNPDLLLSSSEAPKIYPLAKTPEGRELWNCTVYVDRAEFILRALKFSSKAGEWPQDYFSFRHGNIEFANSKANGHATLEAVSAVPGVPSIYISNGDVFFDAHQFESESPQSSPLPYYRFLEDDAGLKAGWYKGRFSLSIREGVGDFPVHQQWHWNAVAKSFIGFTLGAFNASDRLYGKGTLSSYWQGAWEWQQLDAAFHEEKQFVKIYDIAFYGYDKTEFAHRLRAVHAKEVNALTLDGLSDPDDFRYGRDLAIIGANDPILRPETKLHRYGVALSLHQLLLRKLTPATIVDEMESALLAWHADGDEVPLKRFAESLLKESDQDERWRVASAQAIVSAITRHPKSYSFSLLEALQHHPRFIATIGLFFALGTFDREASEYLCKAHQQAPEDLVIAFYLLRFLWLKGFHDEAHRIYERVQHLPTRSEGDRYMMGIMAAKAQDYETAYRLLRTVRPEHFSLQSDADIDGLDFDLHYYEACKILVRANSNPLLQREAAVSEQRIEVLLELVDLHKTEIRIPRFRGELRPLSCEMEFRLGNVLINTGEAEVGASRHQALMSIDPFEERLHEQNPRKKYAFVLNDFNAMEEALR